MSSYLDTTFPYYPSNVKITKPLGNISLKEFIRVLREPNERVRELFENIKKASAEGNLKLKSELKRQLFYFNPCINTDGEGRSYSNIESFTGFAQLDFDGITNAPEFRDWFFENCKSATVVGVSSSGLGVKAIARIPIVKTVEEYKSYFYGMGYYLEDYKGFDIAPQNPALPLYIFHDPDTKWREDATVSTVRGEKINAFKKFEGDITVLEDVPEYKKQKVIDIYTRGIGNIVDNGHPTVVGFSSALGGYVVSGYLSEDEAEILIEECISNNDYLSKDHGGYIRTGKNMLVRGMVSPLYLREDEE